MLQPHESKLLWRKRKRRNSVERLRCRKVYCTIISVIYLTLLPQGLTQYNDDVYVVKPTPALRLGNEEELTTVLLINNENYGRFINVRPEVGLLTSTARTFIQEGITTEYATQVVGTTLDNGHVYAQYLKKSSRVLYDGASVLPSVVTSWVGESQHNDASFSPQSHNDLFNANQPDWQAIDGSLLSDHQNRPNSFGGSTDYVGLRRPSLLSTSSKGDNEVKALLGNFLSPLYTPGSKATHNIPQGQEFLEKTSRKVAANKVLGIGNLPTYTIKHNYEPRIFLAVNGESELSEDNGYRGRNPKLIFKKLMQNSIENKNVNISNYQPSFRPIISASRNFATVTYYGFADFTTMVGDSVIVFSPSTSTNILNYAHVTSIKGEATLDSVYSQGLSISKIPITIAEDIIKPTLTQLRGVDSLLRKTALGTENASSFTFTAVIENNSTKSELYSTILHSSEVVVQTLQSEISSTQSTQSVMLSRPSDEEVLRIFNALANGNSDSGETSIESTAVINTTSVPTSTTSKGEVHKKTSNIESFGGATTIFFEDDLFANFGFSSKTTQSLGPTVTLHNESQAPSDDTVSIKSQSTNLAGNNKHEIFTTSTFESVEVTSEQGKMVETTTNQPLDTSEENLKIAERSNSKTTESVVSKETSPYIIPNVLIKEIDPDNDDDITSDCIRTSQVFLTQLHKPITLFDTVININVPPLSEIREQIHPTFEIKEATKYYCIQNSAFHADRIENQLVTPTVLAKDSNIATIKSNQLFNKSEASVINNDIISNSTEAYIPEIKTEQSEMKVDKFEHSDSNATTTEDDQQDHENDAEGASGQPEEDGDDDEDEDEEIELIYKTLYTTYTYLTTFFHDDVTSVSSHTEVVTNVMTSTLGVNLTTESISININANLSDNEINPTATLATNAQFKSSKRFTVPSQVESLIRTDDDIYHKTIIHNSIESSENSESLATYYTTYTYYTTIFAEEETEIMSRTEVITNIKKYAASTGNFKEIMPTTLSQLLQKDENLPTITKSENENTINYNPSSGAERVSSLNDKSNLPSIPELGDLATITLVTDVRSSSSPGNKHIINDNDKMLQQQAIFEDQISSESNTDTDEIMPSATLLLQTSFTTFTYYTTMYSGDKTNVISRLETITNTVTETLQRSKIIDLKYAAVPVTYFTTYTYWTKLVKEGQITTLSREETISNVITPTAVQQSQIENLRSGMEMTTENAPTTEAVVKIDETMLEGTKIRNNITLSKDQAIQISKQNMQTGVQDSYITNALGPTTYYTTYTYYTTSYETDKTIIDSRFETVTNIITPTVTLESSDENSETLATLKALPDLSSAAPIQIQTQTNSEDSYDLVLYDFKKIIDADGISTIFFTTEIKPTINLEGEATQIISSSSSLLINEDKRNKQLATDTRSLPAISGLPDGQSEKQYKTGLVRLIEGTRIANHTTTLYQSKVIGTIIDQRYAQIIESTSSFIYEKMRPTLDNLISPTNTINIDAIEATDHVSLPAEVKSSIMDTSSEHEIDTGTKSDISEEENSKAEEKLRFPLQTKKPAFLSPLKPFSNRNRPQFSPKRNSSATIITRSDFTPTITATPALKTINRFSSTRRGSINGISISNSGLLTSSSRRFGKPNKSSIQGLSSSLGISAFSAASRNRFVSSSNARSSYSSTRRIGGSATSIRPSFSRPSLFSSPYLGNSRLRVKTTSTIDLGETSSSIDISTTVPLSSQEERISHAQEEVEDEEESTTEISRRQNNPLLRLRKPINRPQGFTPARLQFYAQSSTSSLRRTPLTSRSRSGNIISSTPPPTTTTKPKPRTLISQNRIRPTNSLFPSRNIFGVQKPDTTIEENRDLSEEDIIENNDDLDYEDDEEEDSDGDDEEENNRRRRSNNKLDKIYIKKIRSKREADTGHLNRRNFRNRFRRPKIISPIQAELRSYEDDGTESNDTLTTNAVPTLSITRSRSRFGVRYSSHSSSSAATTAVPAVATPNNKAIRPTRPTIIGRSQFTLREKDSSTASTTQKGANSVKQRLAFHRPQPGSGITSRRLPISTVPASSASAKRRHKTFNTSDTTTTSHNAVTGRSRSSSTTSGRSRTSGSSRDTNRNRARSNHNYNNNNEELTIDNSGTIVVTHVTPAEVTIPVINGKVTEYKQVVTAKTSTEVLAPQQYTTTIAANGLSQLVLTREDSSVNYNGATEVTKYILHETSTTTITFTPTTIRGRKTSYSHVLPSTVYSVEKIVSTLHPKISANAPLANILLSQLLLGNVGLPAANPLLGALGGALTQPGIALGTAVGSAQPATPVTEYKTHASTYITTIYEGQSTVLPVTFQGKKILTTVFDTTAQTITATEFITDTIITTPTVKVQPQPVVNSLLLQQILFQQHLQQQQQLQQSSPEPSHPFNAILNSVPPQLLHGSDNLQELEAFNNIRGSGNNDLLSEDDDFAAGSSADLDDIALQAQVQVHKNGRKKSRKSGRNHKRKNNNKAEVHHSVESSVVTLYVSGRRPGEFSTVLSTVQVRPDSTQYKRQAHTIDSLNDYLNDGSGIVNKYLALPPQKILFEDKEKTENEVNFKNEATQSLESIVGDVSVWYSTQTTATKVNTLKFFGSFTERKSDTSYYIIKESSSMHSNANSSNHLFFV